MVSAFCPSGLRSDSGRTAVRTPLGVLPGVRSASVLPDPTRPDPTHYYSPLVLSCGLLVAGIMVRFSLQAPEANACEAGPVDNSLGRSRRLLVGSCLP